MAVRNQGWNSLNESRDHPFDAAAMLQDDEGALTPLNIISGLKAMIPESAGALCYVGGLSVTPTVVTVLIMAADSLNDAGRLVLSISQRLPIVRHQQYALASQYPGAAGWITFGGGVVQPYRGRFATPSQSLLSPLAVRRYVAPPIASVGKYGVAGLTGLVSLRSGNDIEIVKECREVPDHAVAGSHPQYCDGGPGLQARDVIVFRLRDTSDEQDRNVYDLYRGACGNRPESGNCGEPEPIELINAVSPDCCGYVTIEFRGCADVSEIVEAVTTNSEGAEVSREAATGVVIDCGLSLDDACISADKLPDDSGRLPNDYDDLCDSLSVFSISDFIDDYDE